MQTLLNTYLEKFKKERHIRRRLTCVLLALALLVGTGVYWQLRLTGAALTNETYCGMEEHTHTEECYETVLVCGLEECEATEGHTHTEDCYETQTVLVCGLEESDGHTHSEDCYTNVLSCGLEESEGHTHSADCYDEDGNLICGLEESEGHTHVESCYTLELTCGLEVSEGHIHTDECYETQEVLICGLEECEATEGHAHTEECYEEQLVCSLEEHTHTIECMSDESADVETASDWEATLPTLTGVWADDIVAIAESQLGYTEGTANFVLDEDGETRRGYTRYGAWYGNDYGDWCAMFASFCLHYADVPEAVFPEASGVYAWTVALIDLELYADAEDYIPTAGDIVFIDNSESDGQADHVAVVTEVDEDSETITVIEGNCSDMVMENTYDFSDSSLVGYGVLPEQNTEDSSDVETEATEETTTLTYEGEDYIVTATFGEDAELPEGVELVATEYEQDSETYLERYAEAAELYGWEEEEPFEEDEKGTEETENEVEETDYHGFRLFNIGFYLAGVEVEPTANVTVTVTYIGKDGLETYTVTHFGDEGTETMVAASNYADGNQTVQFNSSSFTDYGISLAAEESNTTYTAYTAGDFSLWIWDNETLVTSYDSSTAYATGLYYYIDSDNVTWYLIPVSTFENVLGSYGYSCDEIEREDCSLYYCPSAYSTGVSNAVQSSYIQIGSEWYVQVQDTTGLTGPRSNVYYIHDEEAIVLNLGNGSGSYSDGDYAGAKDANALRYTVDLSTATKNEDGTVTIILPSDDDLAASTTTTNTFTVVEANKTEDGSAITVDLGKEQSYDYKLVGWYNIATGEYYNVEDDSATAIVDFNNSNVFYADWIAASYDYGSSSDSNLIETEDTSSFIKIYMFDYSELFNIYSTTVTQNGLTSEFWQDSGSLYETPPLASTDGLTALAKSFIFLNNGTHVGSSANDGSTLSGVLGYPSYLNTWNVWTGSSGAAYSGLVSTTSAAVLQKLYDTSAENTSNDLGVYYVGEANYLFSYDETTNYYSYDSASYAASYNQTDERFYVYDGGQSVYGTSNTCFLPYNSYGSSLSAYNGSVNYWFGMNIELTFYLPNDTGVSGGNQINGEDMVFDFSGDDDIWVFVDDVLVLDMGGNHNLLSGTIDFSTGTYTITQSNGTTSTQTFNTITAGSHTLKVYYMERGGWASNLKISFNVVPRWILETASADTMTVTKTWMNSDGSEMTDTRDCPDVTMGLFEKTDADVNSGATSATYGGVTYSLTDGYSYDSNGYVNAYVSSGYLYVLVDTQTLNEDNNWTYAWELLDDDNTYEILELSAHSDYIKTSTSEILQSYDYWSAVSYEYLNGTVTYSNDTYSMKGNALTYNLAVVLTDGSQNGEASTSGYPTTYSGTVIKSNGNEVTTETAQFSQAATPSTTDSTVYTYGVTSDSQVEGALWYVELTGEYNSYTVNSQPYYAPSFYLKTAMEGGKYLAISGNNLILVDSKDLATKFAYNSLGELNTTANNGSKVIIDNTGNYAIVELAESATDTQNIKIYVKQSVATNGKAYTITNTQLPTVTLSKVDSEEKSTLLSGAEFTLSNSSGKYYHYDSTDKTGNSVTWVDGSVNATVLETENGSVAINALADDTYTLTEITAPDGYNLLSNTITFTVSGAKVTEVKYGDNTSSDVVSFDSTDTSLVITITNTAGTELPLTGGIGTWMCGVIGLICSGSAGCLLMCRKRKTAKT